MNKNRKKESVELIRCIAAIAIILGHMGVFGMDVQRPFQDSWFFVELFFLLSGYFTLQHFRRIEKKKDVFWEAFSYTIAKFRSYLPYTIPAILIQYLIYIPYMSGMDREVIIQFWECLPTEMLYLSILDVNGTILFTMWYLSAMFLAFPWFCLLAQMKNKSLYCMIAIGISAFFYLHRYDYGEQSFPNQLYRSFAGLLFGGLTYYAAEYVRKKQPQKDNNIGLQGGFILGILIPVVLGTFNIRALRLCLISFAVCIISLFAKNDKKVRRGNICGMLGTLSLPMILWHWVIGTGILRYYEYLPMGLKIALYWGGTILLSLLHLAIVTGIKRKKSGKEEAQFS